MTLPAHRRGIALMGLFLAGILTAVAEEWQTLKDARFTMFVPTGKIERTGDTKQDETGKTLFVARFYSIDKGGRFFLAGVSEYSSPLDIEEELEANCANLVTEINAQVLNKQRITHDGHPALRFVAFAKNKVHYSSLVVIAPGNVAIQAVASWGENAEPAVVTDALNSLRVVVP